MQKKLAQKQSDKLIKYCFTAAIKSLSDEELPTTFSQFYSRYMIEYCPAGEQLDIKKSSWESIATFCKDMSKSKLIGVTENEGELWIESIDRSHKNFKAFKPVDAKASAPVVPSPRPREGSSGPAVVVCIDR